MNGSMDVLFIEFMSIHMESDGIDFATDRCIRLLWYDTIRVPWTAITQEMAPNGNCWGQVGIVLGVRKNRTSESSPSFRKDVVPIWQKIGFFMESMSIHMESYGIYVATYLYFSLPRPLVTGHNWQYPMSSGVYIHHACIMYRVHASQVSIHVGMMMHNTL